MFLDVLQGFLRKAEKVGKAFGIKDARRLRIDLHFQSHARAVTEAVPVLFQGIGKPVVVEDGRAQIAGEGAHIVDGGFELLAQIGKFVPHPGGHRGVFGQTDPCGDGGKHLSDVVVQLAADRLLLCLLRPQEAFGQEFEFLHLLRHLARELALLAPFHGERAMRHCAGLCSFLRAVRQSGSSQNNFLCTLFAHTCHRFVVGGVVFQQMGIPT